MVAEALFASMPSPSGSSGLNGVAATEPGVNCPVATVVELPAPPADTSALSPM